MQHSPAIAIDPAVPAPRRSPQTTARVSPPPHTATASTADWSAVWSAPGSLPHSGSTSAGQADVAWGIDGTDASATSTPSSSGATTAATSASTNARHLLLGLDTTAARATTPRSPSPPATRPSARSSSRRSRSTARSAASTSPTPRLDWGAPGCSGTPDSSQIWLAYSDIGAPGSGRPGRRARVSPLATSGAARYRSPALAVLPDGRVVVAFRNDAAAEPADRVRDVHLADCPPAATTAAPPSAGSVGPSIVVGDATAPALVSGLVGAPTPSVVAAGGRVTVAWHASVDAGVRAFAAMSTDGGATFGPGPADRPGGRRQPARPAARGDGGRPRRRRLPLGRRDTAACRRRSRPPTRRSPARRRRPGRSRSSCRRSRRPRRRPIPGQLAPLGRGLGVATSSVPTAASPLAATVVAFTDTPHAGGQDVHAVGLLHGTTAPVIAAADRDGVQERLDDRAGDRQRRRRRPAHVVGRGAADDARLERDAISDAARGRFHVQGGERTSAPTRSRRSRPTACRARDARAINVNVVNDPPQITLPARSSRARTRRSTIPVAPASAIRTTIRSPSRSGHRRRRHRRARRRHVAVHPAPRTHGAGLLRAACLRRRSGPPTGRVHRHDRRAGRQGHARRCTARASRARIARGAALRFAATPWTRRAGRRRHLELRRRHADGTGLARSRTASARPARSSVKASASTHGGARQGARAPARGRARRHADASWTA